MSDTKPDLDAIEARRDDAYDEVVRVCDGKRWAMSVPADPERDSDLLIAASLDDVPALVAYARTLEAKLASPEMQLRGHLAYENRIQTERAEAAEAERDQLRETLALRSAAHNRLADEWGAEANRYEQYATRSSTPHELRSIAKTLRQNAAAVREAATLRVLDGDQRTEQP